MNSHGQAHKYLQVASGTMHAVVIDCRTEHISLVASKGLKSSEICYCRVRCSALLSTLFEGNLAKSTVK